MMRVMGILLWGAMLLAGCGQERNSASVQPGVTAFRLLALTSLEQDAAEEGMVLRAYVQTEQEFEPVWFRFELYDYVPLDVNPRGKRKVLWPPIEPKAAGGANLNWRPHLGAYEVILRVEPPVDSEGRYLVEVTALGKDGIRLNDTMKLTPKPLPLNPR